MKKTFIFMAFLIAASISVPVFAGPHDSAVAVRHAPQHNVVRAGHHQMHHHVAPPPRHRPHAGFVIGTHYPSRFYYPEPYYYRTVGWYDDFYPPVRYSSGVYVNFGFPLR